MDYNCLIAGLPELKIEDNKLNFGVADFKKEAEPFLTPEDMRLLGLFYMKFDNQNLLRYLNDRDAKFDERGNITKMDLVDGLGLSVSNDNPKNYFLIPSYFDVFVEEYKNAQNTDAEAATWENRLAELYYEWAMKCDSKMISDWFEYSLNINNILIAYTSRKYQMEVKALGDNDVSETINSSTQRDFGLSGIIDELENILRIVEEPELFEREKKLDLLKWHWLDEQTVFEYFSIEHVFAYIVKLEIIERWLSFDHEEGGKIFNELFDSLKRSAMNKNQTA